MRNRLRRIAAVCLLVLALVLSITGCGASQTEAPAAEETAKEDPAAETVSPDNTEEARTAEGKRILVLYFSRTGEQYTVGVIEKGNTAIVAEEIAAQTGADLFEVLPEKEYPMTYNELTDVAKEEKNKGERPAYKGELPDLSQYETVFIGAPVWWGDWPMIIYTVFENNDFSGKTLIPFSTHEGSGLSGFDVKLAEAVPNAEVAEGLAIRGGEAQNDPEAVRGKVSDWLSRLGV